MPYKDFISVTITVIVPIYNVEKYLTQCLESIVRQSVSFDEVILINDGSTDGSCLVCEKYVAKYDYFKLINQENKGPSAARNAGLDCATSEYVIFLDSDDSLRTDAVEKLKDELRKSRLDAIYFDADIHSERGYEVSKNVYERHIEDLSGIKMDGWSFFVKSYPENYNIPVWGVVYRKKAIDARGIRFPEGLYFEDNYFTFAFMIRAQNVTYISEKLYQRRYRENSITTSKFSEKKFADYVQIVLLVWEEVAKQEKAAFGESKTLLKFVSDYCCRGLRGYYSCIEQNIILQERTREGFYTMLNRYELLLRPMVLGNNNEDLSLINLVLANLKKIALYCPQYKLQEEQMAEKLIGKKKQLYRRLLSNLPLRMKGCKVGIYGTGKHTDGLLAIYESLFGEIVCDLFFIDSHKKNEKYRGRDIVYYKELDRDFDLIIISSFRYRQEMIDNIRNIDKEMPVYDFYDDLKEDVFSGWDLYWEVDNG